MKKKIFKLSSKFLLALSGVAISMSSGIYRFAITMGYFLKKYKNAPLTMLLVKLQMMSFNKEFY